MTDAALLALARRAGLSPRWSDAFRKTHDVSPDTLRAALAALGVPASTDSEIADSDALLSSESSLVMPPLLTATSGQPVVLPCPPGRYVLTTEEGARHEGVAGDRDGRALLPAMDAIGYHRLTIGDAEHTLAVAPIRCFRARADARLWGIAVQLYSLRRDRDGGVGDFSALRDFTSAAAEHGAAAVAISPVHAQFSADTNRFSPYAPSSRVALNGLHIGLDQDDAESARLRALPLVAWPEVARHKLALLRRTFDETSGGRDPAFDAFRREQGGTLETHARFEALHAQIYGRDPGSWHWRNWPEALQDPASEAVAAFARDNAREVAFHAWLQYRADRDLHEAQQAARAAGMPIGLISDLAVGTDSGGSHAWSRQDEMLIGLTVGAPPDLLSPHGQDWGLVAFSPLGLRQHGYAAFIEMLRGALRHAGGVRIDHAMGLARLWVLPEGVGASDGVYLTLPEDDLLRLVALESVRHRAIVLGEDLGTLPEGFQEKLERTGISGMRVLWFERAEDEGFTAPSGWSRDAVAMTSTHDLPTVAGWWSGHDLDLRAGIGQMRDEAQERAARDVDRVRLWSSMAASGAAQGDPPPPDRTGPAVDAAIAHVGSGACALALLPLEDALGQVEQPNLPGTLHEHPNWRRRTALPAARLFEDPAIAQRLKGMAKARDPTA